MNIAGLLRDRARHMGEAAAIVERAGTTSFADLDRGSSRVADQLGRAGVGPADTVLVLCPMSATLYAVLAGIWRVGATAVFLDPSAGRDHVDRCCRLVPPRAVIAVPRGHLLRLFSSHLRRARPFVVSGWVPGAVRLRPDAGVGRDAIVEAGDGTPALLTFTSGSTGEPKAAVRTHGFLLAQHRVLEQDLHLRAGERDLSTLPIFVLANLASGLTSVIPDADLRRPGQIDPVPVYRQIHTTAPTRVAASPAFLDRLVSHASSLGEPMTGFERVFTGGAPVFPGLLRRMRSWAPRATIEGVYGSTEAEPIATLDVADIRPEDFAAMDSGGGLLAGRPVAAIDLRIVADRWGTPLGPWDSGTLDMQTLPPGRIGEIVVAGPHVLSGYHGGVGDADTKLHVDGRVWHRTGDAGYLDSAGRLWLMGRCGAAITDARGVVYPFAVECAASSIPGVARSALAALDGRRVLAVEGGRADGDVMGPLAERLAWAQLDEIRLVPEIPVDRRHNAKVDYQRLSTLLRS